MRENDRPSALGRLSIVEEYAVAVLFAVMVLAVAWAVFSRYVLSSPVAWADLIARLCFTWVTFLGAAVALTHGLNIRVDYFLGLLPPRVRQVIDLTARALVVLLLVVLVSKGTAFAMGTWRQTVPPLELSYGYFALAVPVSSALMLIHLVGGMIVAYLRHDARR